MRKNFLALSLVAATVMFLVPQSFGLTQERERRRTSTSQRSSDDSFDRGDLPERDEFHQSYPLSAGARVEVQGINGTVQVETIPGGTAEVHIVRSARNREDLEYRKVIVEHTATSLIVRGDRDSEGRGLGRNRDVRQRVLLRIPRQVDLGVSGVNGQ